MIKNPSRRRGGLSTRSYQVVERFSAGTKNYFTPINSISANVPVFSNRIETVPLSQSRPQVIDCTDILSEYNLIKAELTLLKTIFSSPTANINSILQSLEPISEES